MLIELSWSNVLEPSTSKTLYKLLKGCKAAAEIRKTSKNMHKLCPGYCPMSMSTAAYERYFTSSATNYDRLRAWKSRKFNTN